MAPRAVGASGLEPWAYGMEGKAAWERACLLMPVPEPSLLGVMIGRVGR